MASIKSKLQDQTWRKGQFLISTNFDLLPVQTLIDVFDSKGFYWAKTLPAEAMKEMLQNSLSFGLYEEIQLEESSGCKSELKFLGLARCVTDFITFVYLTDVWVDPTYQGKGLGTWVVQCVEETLQTMPHLRRSLLFTADWERSVPFYQKLMGMTIIDTKRGEGLAIMESKGRGHPSYGRDGVGYD